MKRFLVPALLLNAALLSVRVWQDFSHEVTAQVAEVILDNGQAGTSFTGTWTRSGAPNPFGGTSLYNSVGGNFYGWQVTLPSNGFYGVYVWWTQLASRAPSARYVVRHLGGTSTFNRDQRSGGGQWNHLGSFEFDRFATVSVLTTAGFSTSADAVRFVPTPGTIGLTPEQAEILSHFSLETEDMRGEITSEQDGVEAMVTNIVISDANLKLVNGTGLTEEPNGHGNLILGYNLFDCDPEFGCEGRHTGSHNVVFAGGTAEYCDPETGCYTGGTEYEKWGQVKGEQPPDPLPE